MVKAKIQSGFFFFFFFSCFCCCTPALLRCGPAAGWVHGCEGVDCSFLRRCTTVQLQAYARQRAPK